MDERFYQERIAMRRSIVLLGAALALLGCALLALPAAAQSEVRNETFMGDLLCLPEAYAQAGSDCLPAGPAQALTQLDQQGLSIPLRPLPASSRLISNSECGPKLSARRQNSMASI